jgi:hypothetical protein
MKPVKLHDKTVVLLVLLLASDLAYICIHLMYSCTHWIAPNPLYSLSLDRSYSEFYQYIKFLWIALLCLVLWIERRQAAFLGWFFTFMMLMLDDSWSIHEKAGYRLAEVLRFKLAFGLRPEDFGESLFILFEGLLILAVLGLTHLHSDRPVRGFSLRLLSGLAALAFFGVFVDLVHIELLGTAWAIPAGVIEDGGELVAASVLLWLVFRFQFTDS